MSLATLAQVRALVEEAIPVDDTDLQSIIDREEAEMVARLGAHGDGSASVTETVARVNGMAFLSRAPLSITSITEAAYPGGTATTLAASAYYAWLPEARIQFYPGGTLLTPADDRTVVTVVYVPKDDREKRRGQCRTKRCLSLPNVYRFRERARPAISPSCACGVLDHAKPDKPRNTRGGDYAE
jgi:hypothetical protein